MNENTNELDFDQDDYIWCWDKKEGEWFKTILLAKLPDTFSNPYCVVVREDLDDYLNGCRNIKAEMYLNYETSFEKPNNDNEITINEGIKILEEHGYKVIK